MVSVAIGTAGAISAYFFGRAFFSHGLNESDPIKWLLLPLSDCLPVFGCGLVFWLLVLLWPKLRYKGGASVHSGDKGQKDIAEVATLNAAITAINIVGCLALASKQLALPREFHSLILFQLSSNLALLLIWALASIRKRIVDIEEKNQKIPIKKALNKIIRKERKIRRRKSDNEAARASEIRRKTREIIHITRDARMLLAREDFDMWFEYIRHIRRNYDFAREESEGGEKSGGGGEEKSGGGEKSGGDPDPEHGREDNGGGSGGDGGGGGGGGDPDPEHGRKDSGGGPGRDGGGGGGGGDPDPEHGDGVTERNNESSFQVSKISEMSLMLIAQTSAAVIGFHLTNPSFSTRVLFVLVMLVHLVGYLCSLTAILLQLQNQNQNPRAARDLANVAFACSALGYILMISMFLDWYLVLIAVLSVGIFSIIFFRRYFLDHLLSATPAFGSTVCAYY